MAFSYYKSVTIDHTQCGATDSSNFPVTIWVTDADLKSTGNGGFVTSTSGYDIRPYSDAALTTALTYELVLYTATTGVLEMHVKIPTVSHTADTVFYLAFGDASIVSDGSSTATWSNSFEMVYHLKDGTTLALTDSTSNARTLTNNNTATATAGQIDGAVALASASSQSLSTTSLPTATALTATAWVKATSFPQAYNVVVSLDVIANTANKFFRCYVKSTGKLAFYVNNGVSASNYDGTGANTLSTATPYHLAFAYANGGGTGYVNASVDGTVGNVGGLATETKYQIGVDPFPPRYWNGVMDEVRLSSVARSADWITAEYNNQKAASTFLTWSAKTPVGSLVGLGVYIFGCQ